MAWSAEIEEVPASLVAWSAVVVGAHLLRACNKAPAPVAEAAALSGAAVVVVVGLEEACVTGP